MKLVPDPGAPSTEHRASPPVVWNNSPSDKHLRAAPVVKTTNPVSQFLPSAGGRSDRHIILAAAQMFVKTSRRAAIGRRSQRRLLSAARAASYGRSIPTALHGSTRPGEVLCCRLEQDSVCRRGQPRPGREPVCGEDEPGAPRDQLPIGASAGGRCCSWSSAVTKRYPESRLQRHAP